MGFTDEATGIMDVCQIYTEMYIYIYKYTASIMLIGSRLLPGPN